MKSFFHFLFLLARIPIHAFLCGWVIMNYWNWFLFQKIDGLQEISFKVAVGVGLVIGAIYSILAVSSGKIDLNAEEKSKKERFTEELGRTLALVVIALVSIGSGMVFHYFMK